MPTIDGRCEPGPRFCIFLLLGILILFYKTHGARSKTDLAFFDFINFMGTIRVCKKFSLNNFYTIMYFLPFGLRLFYKKMKGMVKEVPFLIQTCFISLKI